MRAYDFSAMRRLSGTKKELPRMSQSHGFVQKPEESFANYPWCMFYLKHLKNGSSFNSVGRYSARVSLKSTAHLWYCINFSSVLMPPVEESKLDALAFRLSNSPINA